MFHDNRLYNVFESRDEFHSIKCNVKFVRNISKKGKAKSRKRIMMNKHTSLFLSGKYLRKIAPYQSRCRLKFIRNCQKMFFNIIVPFYIPTGLNFYSSGFKYLPGLDIINIFKF